MQQETVTVTGAIFVRKNGVLVHEDHNLVVQVGKNLHASRLIGNADAALAYIAVGSGQTAPAAGDTDLQSMLGSRKTFDSAATRTNNVVTMTTTFNAGEATGTIWEFGLFNASTGGSMYSHSVGTAGIPKGANDVVAVTWQLTCN